MTFFTSGILKLLMGKNLYTTFILLWLISWQIYSTGEAGAELPECSNYAITVAAVDRAHVSSAGAN
jgi:hypothetical protein